MGRGIKNKAKNILTFTFSHLQFTNLSATKQSPPFFLPGDSASKGEPLVEGRSPGRRQSCQTHHHLLGPSSPDTATGKPLASATPSWNVLSRGHGSARDPSSGPKSPHGGSQDHGMEQKKGMMEWCWEERGTCAHGNRASGQSPTFLTVCDSTRDAGGHLPSMAGDGEREKTALSCPVLLWLQLSVL